MRLRTRMILLGVAATLVAVIRHMSGGGRGHRVSGGTLIGDAVAYDRLTRVLLGSFYRGIAADVASIIPVGGQILEVGCGPGHLSILLARQHDLDVTGLDIDPAMVDRAQANARELNEESRPAFFVADVAAMPFPDESFDLVVSSLSVHHWSDPGEGMQEISRVLRSEARALIWDIRPGFLLLHGRHRHDPMKDLHVASLRLVRATPWEWPRKLKLTERIELARG